MIVALPQKANPSALGKDSGGPIDRLSCV